MIKRLIWTIWTPMSSVLKKADKLNLSLSLSLEIAVRKKLLTSDGARMKSSVSLIKQVALVGQQHEAFGLQSRVVDVAHVGQAHPCYTSRTAEYPPRGCYTIGRYLIHPKLKSHQIPKSQAQLSYQYNGHFALQWHHMNVKSLAIWLFVHMVC